MISLHAALAINHIILNRDSFFPLNDDISGFDSFDEESLKTARSDIRKYFRNKKIVRFYFVLPKKSFDEKSFEKDFYKLLKKYEVVLDTKIYHSRSSRTDNFIAYESLLECL